MQRGSRPDVGAAADAEITVCPDGPLLVRGGSILGTDGRLLERRRATVALCRCGRSGLAPWCDGTHKVVGFTDPVPPAEGAGR